MNKFLPGVILVALCATSRLPASALYDLDDTVLAGGSGANTFFVSNGQTAGLTYDSGTPSLLWNQGTSGQFTYFVGYFNSQTLASIGDSISLTYTITPAGAAAFQSVDQAFRVGFFNSGGTQLTNNTTANGDAAFNTDTGYMATYRPNGTPVGAANTISQRTGSNNVLITTSVFTQVPGAPTLQSPGTGQITGSLTFTLQTATTLSIVSKINAGSDQIVTDTSGLVTSFDMFSFFALSGDSTAGSDLNFTDLTVTYNSVPEPQAGVLLGGAALVLCAARRKWRHTS